MEGSVIQGIPLQNRLFSDGYMYQNGRFSHLWFSIPIQDSQGWIYVPKLQVQPSMVFHSNRGEFVMDTCTKIEGSAIQGIPFKYRIVSDRFMYENGRFSHPGHCITKQFIQRWIYVPKWQVWQSRVFHYNTDQLAMDICTKMVGSAIQGIPFQYRIVSNGYIYQMVSSAIYGFPFQYRMVSDGYMYQNGRFIHLGYSIAIQNSQRWIYVPKQQVWPSMVFHSSTGCLAMDLCHSNTQ